MTQATRLILLLLACNSLSCGQDPSQPDAAQEQRPPADLVINEPIQPIPLQNDLDPRRVLLGEKLFHEARLSQNNQISCSSCHNLHLGGTDRKTFSAGLNNASTQFNAPTVFNASFNFVQFWDGRAKTLEDQVQETTHSIIEMGASSDMIVDKVSQIEDYSALFAEAYSDGLTWPNIKNALADYVRSLTTPNSRFDLFLRGDQTAITAREKLGYHYFKTYGCVSCHQGVGVGGNIFETFGILGNPFEEGATERDFGRFNVTSDELDRFVFKVPSLRNVAITPPYFHDGSVKRLEDAVQTMARYQLGRLLTDEEKQAIVAFLKTLTGQYRGEPLDRDME